MRQVRLGLVLVWALMLLLMSAPVHAQETSVANPELEEQAMAVLKRMAEFLSQAPRFSVTLDIGFDAVQDSGQKIEFGETRQVVLRRPDHLRIDATKRDRSKSVFLFDGKDMTVVHPQENVYATVAKPGSVDEAVAYFVQVVITYRRADGRPQFWAQLSDWNLSPEVPDALFAFTPPTGAAQIAFSPQQMLPPGAAVTHGGQ